MTPKKVIRCSSDVHTQHEGNILCAVEGNKIFIKCQDRGCRSWTKLTITVPGVKLNLTESGITQEAMPADYHLHLQPAITVISKEPRGK